MWNHRAEAQHTVRKLRSAVVEVEPTNTASVVLTLGGLISATVGSRFILIFVLVRTATNPIYSLHTTILTTALIQDAKYLCNSSVESF